MRKIYYYKDRPVYQFHYHWTDDNHYNLGINDDIDTYIGTQKGFDDYVKDHESNYGFEYWNLTKKYATKKQYKMMLYCLGEKWDE